MESISKHKLRATLTNHPSPLEEVLFEGSKTIEFFVADPHDPGEVLSTLEPLIVEIRGNNTTAIVLKVETESGNTILHGTIRDGFNGVSIS